MTKIVAYMGLLYGKDYLDAAIRSVIDGVDELHIMYSTRPWQQYDHSTGPCPETRLELFQIAIDRAGKKLRWHDGVYRHLGHQNDQIYQFAPNADVLLNVDADEIWPEELLEQTLRYATAHCHTAEWRTMRIPFIHFWRSMHQAVLHDPSWPIRVILPKRFDKNTQADHVFTETYGYVNHMGYAQRSEIVRYKLDMHMHAPEFKLSPAAWFNMVFMDTERKTDLHLCGNEHWNAEPVNPLDYMPGWMKDHPYYGLEIVP